jgi:hypothetical protein
MMLFMNGRSYPSLFHSPQICLLIDTLFSVGAAGLIFQRYRGVSTRQIHKTSFVLVGLSVVGVATGSQLLAGWNPYIDLLSAIIMLCTAFCAHWLWRASNSSLAGGAP